MDWDGNWYMISSFEVQKDGLHQVIYEYDNTDEDLHEALNFAAYYPEIESYQFMCLN